MPHEPFGADVGGLKTVKNYLGDVRGKEGEFKKAPYITAGHAFGIRNFVDRALFIGKEPIEPSVGLYESLDESRVRLGL